MLEGVRAQRIDDSYRDDSSTSIGSSSTRHESLKTHLTCSHNHAHPKCASARGYNIHPAAAEFSCARSTCSVSSVSRFQAILR